MLFGLVLAFSLYFDMEPGGLALAAVTDLLYINLVWGILNLMPLWPLDGGQILGVGLGMISPKRDALDAHGRPGDRRLHRALVGVNAQLLDGLLVRLLCVHQLPDAPGAALRLFFLGRSGMVASVR